MIDAIGGRGMDKHAALFTAGADRYAAVRGRGAAITRGGGTRAARAAARTGCRAGSHFILKRGGRNVRKPLSVGKKRLFGLQAAFQYEIFARQGGAAAGLQGSGRGRGSMGMPPHGCSKQGRVRRPYRRTRHEFAWPRLLVFRSRYEIISSLLAFRYGSLYPSRGY